MQVSAIQRVLTAFHIGSHLAEEITNPQRNVPIAIGLQMAIGFVTGLCYIIAIMVSGTLDTRLRLGVDYFLVCDQRFRRTLRIVISHRRNIPPSYWIFCRNHRATLSSSLLHRRVHDRRVHNSRTNTLDTRKRQGDSIPKFCIRCLPQTGNAFQRNDYLCMRSHNPWLVRIPYPNPSSSF
jgi:hypothetical protein